MNSRRKGSVNQRGWPGGAQVEIGSHSMPCFTPSMRLRMRASYSGVSLAVGGPPSGVCRDRKRSRRPVRACRRRASLEDSSTRVAFRLWLHRGELDRAPLPYVPVRRARHPLLSSVLDAVPGHGLLAGALAVVHEEVSIPMTSIDAAVSAVCDRISKPLARTRRQRGYREEDAGSMAGRRKGGAGAELA